jgi:hypothetical protein
MSLFKHAMVSGINDALVDSGIVSWPNENVGFEVCSKVAADLDGPEMLPEGGLAKESALLIGERLKQASDTLIANGYVADAGTVLRTKQAAAMDFGSRAAMMAEACMSKAAEEASLTSVGPNTAESAVQTDQHAALDQKNRATNKYLMGVGRTAFPNGGVVGQQMLAPGAPNQAGRNSLTSLDKQAGMLDAIKERYQAFKNRGAAAHQQELAQMAEHLADPASAHMYTPEDRASLEQYVASTLAPKQANEDMSAADLGGQMPEGMPPEGMDAAASPGRLERAMAFLRAMKNKIPSFRPSPEAQVAAAGLGEAGTPGMEVMAHVLDTVKTASEAEDVLQQILHHQGEAGELASPELVEAIEHMMARDESPKAGVSKEAGVRDMASKAFKRVLPEVGSIQHARNILKDRGIDSQMLALDLARKELGSNVATLAGKGALTVGAAYGAKKLHDRVGKKTEPASESPAAKEEEKAAALYAYLKAAAEGSLTDVGENTEESAAHTDSVAELDLKNRAANAYLAGVGNTKMPNKGQVYAVEPAPHHDAVHTDNLPTNETKSAELAYVNTFRKIASELGPYLPATMGREEKVAHLQTLMGLPPGERAGYLKALRAG